MPKSPTAVTLRPGITPEAEELFETVESLRRATTAVREFLDKHPARCRCPVCASLRRHRGEPNELMPLLQALVVMNSEVLCNVQGLRMEARPETAGEAEAFLPIREAALARENAKP